MKILIVDDEANILEMIKNITPWASLGFTEVFEANEGTAALELVQQQKPDVLLTDIEMPVVDGLELARRVITQMEQPPEIIFLTCHADFDYARQAMRFGATDYLLKPFLPEELTAVLSKVAVRCSEKQQQHALSEKADMLAENQDYMMRSFLRDMLDHSVESSASGLRKEADKRNLMFDTQAQSRLIAIGISLEEALKKYTKSELMFMLQNIAREIMYGLENRQDDFLIDYIVRHYYTAFLVVSEKKYTRKTAEEKCVRLCDVLKHYLHIHSICVVSESVCPEKFADKRDQMDLLLAHNVSCSSNVMFLEDANDEKAFAEVKINQKEIVRYLREKKKNEVFLYMRHFMEHREKQLDARQMKMIHHDLMQVFYGYLYENNISTHDFLQDEISQTIQDSAEYSSTDMMKYVSYMYDRVMECIDQSIKSESVIEKAKKFVEMYYMENIGRTEIAKAVMLAPNYLSILFNKETGQTIRDYINVCRVENAKQFMATTNNSITDIALQVGFDNISYFSTVFKKYTGLSPAEYRHQLSTNETAASATQ